MSVATQVNEEGEIRSLIDQWARALEAKDIDRLVANYAPDALLFDAIPPFQTKGVEGYRRLWEACLPHFPDAFKSEHRQVKIAVSGDVAFCHCLHHIVPLDGPHPAGQTWLRVTVCYRKIEGKWLVVHEHVSTPFNPMTGQAAFIDDAQVAAAVRRE
jgi:uncharacterized protein (TIGR02246 family)